MQTSRSAWRDYIFSGSIERRLECGSLIAHLVGANQGLYSETMTSLDSLTEAAENVSSQMARMQFGRFCISCATSTSGGCCSSYMAGEVDGLQLAMNLLSGVSVRVVRDDTDECCFLGESGCIFTFKPMFCLNYLCNTLTTVSPSSQLTTLGQYTGSLLLGQYLLEQTLLDALAVTTTMPRGELGK